MSGPADYIARHRAGELAPGVRVVVNELARIARMARMGKPGFQQDVWISRITQKTLAEYANLCREQVNRNLGIAKELKVIERRGYTYAFLGVAEHDAEIEMCDHKQCRAEVRGRFRGSGDRPRIILPPAVRPAGGLTGLPEGDGLGQAVLDAAGASMSEPISRAVRRHLRSA